jgi:hypothetical protein
MTMIRNSMKTAGLIMGLLLLGSAMAPLADAEAVVCESRGTYYFCWIQR